MLTSPTWTVFLKITQSLFQHLLWLVHVEPLILRLAKVTSISQITFWVTTFVTNVARVQYDFNVFEESVDFLQQSKSPIGRLLRCAASEMLLT